MGKIYHLRIKYMTATPPATPIMTIKMPKTAMDPGEYPESSEELSVFPPPVG